MASHAESPNLKIRDEVSALKRERTIGAAVDLFYEHGYENTTLEAVAERLGVTKPFIYANIGSKGELLAEICSRGIASALQAIDSVLDTPASPTDSLTELGRRFIIAVLESQKHIAIYTREEKNLAADDARRIGEMRREFDAKLTKLLEKGIASGEFQLEDARMAALSIGGMVSWAYVWYRPNGRLKLSEVAERMTKLILALAGVGPAGQETKPRPRRTRAK